MGTFFESWKGVKKYWSGLWRRQHWFDGVGFAGCLWWRSPCNWVRIILVVIYQCWWWCYVVGLYDMLLISTISCHDIVCRVIPKTLMPREVMLRCFGGTSSIMIANKKKMTKYLHRGTHRTRDRENYLHTLYLSTTICFSCSNPTYPL